MMSQVSTLDALNDLHISSNGPSSAQAQANANTTGPEPIIVDAPDFTPSKRKRTAFQSFASPELSPQKTLDGANPSDEIPEGSPVKKLRSADPIMPSIAQVLRRTAAGEYQRKLSVRLAQTKSMKFTSASVSRSQTTTTTTQATRTQSAPGVKMEVLVEKDDIYEEVQKRLREKRNNEHKLVEGNEKKRRRRSSTNSKEREDGERHKRLRVVSIPRVKPHRRSTSASGTGSLENRGRERSRF